MTAIASDTTLLPCPFCGGGESQMWMDQPINDTISVSVRHWCEPVAGQPSRMIERIGRDRESAIAAWNMRAQSAQAPAQPIARIYDDGYWISNPKFKRPLNFAWLDVYESPAGVPAQPTMSAERAFNLGWMTAAKWAHRDDLVSDMDSSAYLVDRAQALARRMK